MTLVVWTGQTLASQTRLSKSLRPGTVRGSDLGTESYKAVSCAYSMPQASLPAERDQSGHL